MAPDKTPLNQDGSATRTETDSFGPIEVPADRYWGAQTERSRRNFKIGVEVMPQPLIRALAMVKKAAALTNLELGLLDKRLADAIAGSHEFPDLSAAYSRLGLRIENGSLRFSDDAQATALRDAIMHPH